MTAFLRNRQKVVYKCYHWYLHYEQVNFFKFQTTTDDLWKYMMQLARKKRFRRQYGDRIEYGGSAATNDSATKISFHPEKSTGGNYDDISPDEYESLRIENASSPSLPGSSYLGTSSSNDGTCGMFCDFETSFYDKDVLINVLD